MKPEPIHHTASSQLEVLLPSAAPHGFDYAVPDGLSPSVGDIVSVPFGRGESLGVVWGNGTAQLAAGKLKPIALHHSEFPALSEPFREFINWAAWYNCAPLGAMLKMALPVSDIAKKGRIQLDTSIDESKIALADLSDMQKTAADRLSEKIGQGFSVSLLDGVTGSGKTEVYYDAIATALKQSDKQALILLPEIALSVQWLARFEKRFGFRPLIWNSEVTPAQKRASWQAISRGEARVVVGARSALFLPYKNLSLVIVDEEHDASYKQEDGVIYHARDMAVARGRFEKFPVILVSATPSLETYHNVQTGKYHEVQLHSRHNEAQMPDIEMLDMREVETGRGQFICEPLRKSLAQTIEDGHQAMLFLNRRGYAPLMLCRSCGHRFECSECSSWLVAHKSQPRLACHHCGHSEPIPEACPECGTEGELHACGPGVERLLEEVKHFLPTARVAVMASDQLSSYSDIQETIKAMQDGKVDLLIGTQMIAKGHHFAGLATVGVVDADLGLAGGDLRAAEKTYQLLHQLSGRAGRAEVKGKVYLQSFLPEHPVMKALLSGDREAFFAAELAARENAHMPPFSRLAAVIVEGTKEQQVIQTARALAAQFTSHDSRLTLLGPTPAAIYMLRGKYRYRLLIKADRKVNLPELLTDWVKNTQIPSSVRAKLDMDPVSFV
ncbi:MAG: replication restart helicase PriA [Rickettsiales bacterium]